MKGFSVFFPMIFLLSLLAACDSGSQRPIDREALREEMRNREPKKLSEAQITAEAFRQGRMVAEAMQAKLLNKLQKAMKEGGVPAAIEYCSLQALPSIDSLSKKHGLSIRRSSLHFRNPANKPDELEKQLLEAYQYNKENKLSLEENVQRIGETYLLYTQPIFINKPLCLNCHGKAGEEIATESLQLLDSLYPNDKARGYQMGDFRGIWSIRLSRKELVNAL